MTALSRPSLLWLILFALGTAAGRFTCGYYGAEPSSLTDSIGRIGFSILCCWYVIEVERSTRQKAGLPWGFCALPLYLFWPILLPIYLVKVKGWLKGGIVVLSIFILSLTPVFMDYAGCVYRRGIDRCVDLYE